MKKAHKKKKYLIAVAIALVLGMAGVLLFLVTKNTPSQQTSTIDTSSWKDFNSSSMGISLKYPAELTVTNFEDGRVNGTPKPGLVLGPQINLKASGYDGPRRWLDFTLYVDRIDDTLYDNPNPAFAKLDTDAKVIETLQINGATFKLVDPGDSENYARFYICRSDNTCASAITRPDGTYITMAITTSGEASSPRPKLDATNPEYNKLIAAVKTLRFEITPVE